MTEDTAPEGQQPPADHAARGSMRFQDPESTKPREPTLAEQRARQKAIAAEEEREAAQAETERKAAGKRKVLIGSGVTVGLVGMVAAWYLVGVPNETTAVCTDANGVVVPDDNCDETYLTSHGGHYDSGTGFWILPLGNSYGQYRYNYGGSGRIGSTVVGGSYTKPSGHTTVKTSSGKTVQRGGFGISSKSSSGS
ncbi:hypothetical protein ORV05_31915 [Amycolatopsis cynarae]|uniref:Uncharacterized protein n=1 Tax=Amycolatopsis cynarae TaxID=2995223 RepID=A0ABY7AZJ3_9PSEU|nr:hypothetical protein [Amycolatopsis sp. HUAS 11-8]WAL65447.1 hypothetical protein ORV05_31915 [Amycolatopsis sp. HUAS 11-8]